MKVDTTTEMVKMAAPPFDKPLGHDCPPESWIKAITWRPCQLTVGDRLFSGKYHVVLESQQPRMAFKLHNKARGQVVFTAKNCSIETGFEQDTPDLVNQHRGQFELKGGLLSFIKIRPSVPPAMPSKATASLMARLLECGYPSTLLSVNYRNHPQILELFNSTIYKGTLRPGPSNSEPERVRDTWDDFTSKRHHFHGQFLAGVRRLFISVIGNATREEHGTSFENVLQAAVIQDLLAELYSFTTAGDQSIRAGDVMIISPYKVQRRLISRTLGESGLEARNNLTFDAAQGQEAPIVLLSLAKPGEVATSLGFMANKERLNVALSRAQKVLIAVGNLSVWGEGFVKSLAAKNNSGKVLRELLMDVKQRTTSSHGLISVW
ncbi:hypothetical protein PMG11_01030 [Penicillium brasilianum]|uniref:DNA2/NAM7 helicase-like C-terminal domain-containing protein n=1 Tax=Penicillium brasilianum TaxID=104259 RepID=A0A0F7TDY8_PENBI|nr:hypothetical protein PMG11_01030 [Penicillium brasilianum]